MQTTVAPPEPLSTASRTVRVAVLGADTPRGRELTSLLRLHPRVTDLQAIARDGSLRLGRDAAAEPRWSSSTPDPHRVDLAFVCGATPEITRARETCTASGARVIELGGALREAGLRLARELGDVDAAYGLPEFAGDDLSEADRVATAGGLATCATLALGPAARAGLLAARIDVRARVGVSDAAPQRPVCLQQVQRELQANLDSLHRCARKPLVSIQRRIDPLQAGVYVAATLNDPQLDASRVQRLYSVFYIDTPCVEVLPTGLPTPGAIQGTNKAQLGIRQTCGGVEVACALDASLKGAVGQAIQTMNLMCGFPETLGLPEFEFELPGTGLRPVPRPRL